MVKIIHKERPDVLLLDVMLGDMEGRDICKELKQADATHDLPVIIVSASHGWHTMHKKNAAPMTTSISLLISMKSFAM